MERRLKANSLKEVPVQADGSCLFRSVSAALFGGSEAKHDEIRQKAASWLKENENFELASIHTDVLVPFPGLRCILDPRSQKDNFSL